MKIHCADAKTESEGCCFSVVAAGVQGCSPQVEFNYISVSAFSLVNKACITSPQIVSVRHFQDVVVTYHLL